MANKFKTLDKMVYNLLLEKIKNGELVANEHLAEEKLAREFVVSRSPIRKPLQRLLLKVLLVITKIAVLF